MDDFVVQCVKAEPDNGVLVFRELHLKRDVLYIEVVSRFSKVSAPPGTISFITVDGTWYLLHSIEMYERLLRGHGFDLFTTSLFVNTAKVAGIRKRSYGHEAYFIGAEDIVIPISKSKTKTYKHLIKR